MKGPVGMPGVHCHFFSPYTYTGPAFAEQSLRARSRFAPSRSESRGTRKCQGRVPLARREGRFELP
eukprot:scaffold35234_cov28-Tisochrysis_lutea.AAC.4